MLFKAIGQKTVSLVGFGDNNETRCILIQPMNDTGPGPSPDARQVPAVMKKRVNEGPGVMAGGRVHDETGWFVDNQESRILMDDIEGNSFRFEVQGFGGGYVAGDTVPGPDLGVCLRFLPIDPDITFFN